MLVLPAPRLHAEPVKIGVSLPLSGDGASYGQDYRRIYLYANEALTGGRLRLLFEDDRCTGKDAVAVAQKLINVDKVKYVLGVTCDTVFSSVGAIYERAGVTVVSTSGAFVPGRHLFHTELRVREWALPLLHVRRRQAQTRRDNGRGDHVRVQLCRRVHGLE